MNGAGMSPPRRAAGGGYVMEGSRVVPREPGEAFAFFADPRGLARLVPGWLGFRLLEGELSTMEEGRRLRYRIAPLLVPIRWTSEVVAWEPPRWFVDEQVRGPFARWRHEHRFEPEGEGTRVHDRILYAMPLGPAGRLVHRLVVGRQLRAIFRHRERRIAKLLGGEGRESTPEV